MSTEMKHTFYATKEEEQYDASAKRLLGNKSVLANILVHTLEEFKGMDWREAETYIEGEPVIGRVPVEPGLTNRRSHTEDKERIVGLNTELAEINEGVVTLDVLFYVRMPTGLSKVIINVEAQKDEPTLYDILNRAVFYSSRLISSQKEREFSRINYNDIKQVYSIWICMNMKECCMNHIHLVDEALLGTHQWKGNIDLFNIILIGISNRLPAQEKAYELHRLLTALFSNKLDTEERIKIVENEYGILTESDTRKELSVMCNLGRGVLEQGLSQGRDDMILKMYKNGMDIESIARIAELDVEVVQEMIQKVDK